MQSPYRTTRRSYKNHGELFIEYLKTKLLSEISIIEFDNNKAIDFLDYLSTQGIVNNTWNNKLRHIRAIFTELVKRHHIPINPFFGIKEKDPSKVVKDCLTSEEMKILSPAIKKHNVWLYWSICLASYLLIRQEELSRIKFNFFDLQRGTLHLPKDVTKNKQEAYLTIPKFLLFEMIEGGFFSNHSQNWYVFGDGIQPHPNKSVGEKALNAAHRKVYKKLERDKKLIIRKGVSYSSWRKTFFNIYGEILNPKEQDELYRHLDPTIKLVYYKKKQVIQTIRNLKPVF